MLSTTIKLQKSKTFHPRKSYPYQQAHADMLGCHKANQSIKLTENIIIGIMI
jgi:hypothetical protein